MEYKKNLQTASGRTFPYRAAVSTCNGSCSDGLKETACRYGCNGCGSCVTVCRSGAVLLKKDKAARIIEEKCTACGLCVEACPKNLIRLHDRADFIVVKCANLDKGKEAKAVCTVSCIGCGICEKTCTAGAVQMADNRPVIDETLCLSCGMCAVKCPRHAIVDLKGILTAV